MDETTSVPSHWYGRFRSLDAGSVSSSNAEGRRRARRETIATGADGTIVKAGEAVEGRVVASSVADEAESSEDSVS